MAGLVDVHTHLSSEDFDSDRAEVVERALKVCDFLIDIGAGTSALAYERARRLAEDYPRVYFTAGIHPHDASTLGSQPEILKRIEELISHPKCVAIGECGLDYYYKNSSSEDQKRVFQWQIDLAKQVDLPLMIHTRDAEEDTKLLLNSFSSRAIFHCFTGSSDLANFGVSKDFMISFSGIVTFKNAEALRKTYLQVPMRNILVETDSPFLAPVPMRGKRNESEFIQYTAAFLASLRDLPLEKFSTETSGNALRTFAKIRLPTPGA